MQPYTVRGVVRHELLGTMFTLASIGQERGKDRGQPTQLLAAARWKCTVGRRCTLSGFPAQKRRPACAGPLLLPSL